MLGLTQPQREVSRAGPVRGIQRYQQFIQQAPIPGLTLKLPEGVNEQALVILNVPASYSVARNTGGVFNISVDGTMLKEYAEYDFTNYSPSTRGRSPATLVVAVPLILKNQTVVAYAANCIIDSSASLSVIT